MKRLTPLNFQKSYFNYMSYFKSYFYLCTVQCARFDNEYVTILQNLKVGI